MSLSSYLADRLQDLASQWARSLQTLPAGELDAQVDALTARRGREGTTSPSAFVLALLNDEKARRAASPRKARD